MPRLANNIAVEFASRCLQIESVRKKMEELFTNGHISLDDILQVYAGLFLDVFTSFELSVEDLFIGLLEGDIYSKTRPVNRLILIKPSSDTRKVVFNFKSYIDWLPVDDKAIPLAKRYFNDGEPFSLLSTSQITNLKFYHYIRNAIAHKSASAQANFAKVIAGKPLLPHEKSPTGYLRSTPASISPQTQFEIAVSELRGALNHLCI